MTGALQDQITTMSRQLSRLRQVTQAKCLTLLQELPCLVATVVGKITASALVVRLCQLS